MVDQTPALKAVITELEKRLGDLPGSHTPQVIRPIIVGGKQRPDLGYSQHSYRNASDIMIAGSKQDAITSTLQQMKSQGFPVGTVLDRNYNADHADHVHVEGSPKITGDPRKPETWSSGGSSSPGAVAGYGRGNAGQRSEIDNENLVTTKIGASLSDVWQWITNPTEQLAELVQPLLYRIGFGILALLLLGLTIFIAAKAFTEEGLNIDVTALATRGLASSK